MPVVHYQNATFEASESKSVLEALTDAGIDIPNSCHAGACQSCKLQATEGELPALSQQGLSGAEKQLGYFLSCQCFPTHDITIAEATSSHRYSAKVLSKNLLNDSVMQVTLDAPFAFLSGQFVNIIHGDITRSYSIASTPASEIIELHIKKLPGGLFSGFAFESLSVGDTLVLQGPFGKCIYNADASQPLMLAGLGTGLAPLLGILRTALNAGHTGPIHLVAGAKHPSGLYHVEELLELARQHSNLNVDFVTQEGSSDASTEVDIYQFCKASHPSTKDYAVFLCGAPSFVNKLKKQSFLLGANMADIHADSFTPCA